MANLSVVAGSWIAALSPPPADAAIMTVQITEFALQGERDANWASQRARLLGSLAGLPPRRRSAFGKAVRAAARQAVAVAGSGTITFALTTQDARTRVQAVVRFAGAAHPGFVDDAQRALPPIEEFVLENDGQGVTLVRLGVELPAAAAPVAERVAAEWGTALATRTTQGALSRSQQQICELAAKLDDARQRGVNLEHELQQIRTLNETLELLALVASKTHNAVIVMDAQGVVEWVNDGFVHITGYGLGEVRGKPVVDVMYGPTTDEEASRDVRRALASGHGLSQDIRNQRKDGQVYWAAVSITPVFNEQGHTTRWIGIANDVTRRRQAEEQLRQAKDAAEAANQSKSQFLANMSHEIRTPMNAIIGMTDLALDTPLSDQQREYLTTVRESSESLLALLNDVLDLSKIEAGKIDLESLPFRVAQTVVDTCKPLLLEARRKGLRLTHEVAENVPPVVVGDPGRLRQVLMNLVGNAIKFTARGEVEVRVDSHLQAADQVVLSFSVRDTGEGIPADKLPDIFAAFTQADSSTTRRYGGTGLGLAISSQLIEMMGGHISVDSRLGHGSTFRFTICCGLPPRESALREAAPAALTGARAPRRLHVLVADDNRANRIIATRILEKCGHRVTQVGTGREAVDAVCQQAFDVALLDVQMPDMDGFESTAAIRRRERQEGGHLPIVAMTAYAMKGDRDRCLAAGMDAYLSKPVRAADLQMLVESLANEPGGVASSQAAAARPSPDQAALGIDLGPALERLEGDLELLGEQIDFFLRDAPPLLDQLRAAVAAGDAHQLHVAAHRLKGLAAGFDAAELVAVAEQLEQMGRQQNLTEAPAAWPSLQDHFTRLHNALQQYRHLAVD